MTDVNSLLKAAEELLQRKEYTKAEAAYRRAIEIRPDLAEAWFNLGVALGKQRKHTEAEVAHRRAIELRPDYPEAWLRLGVALLCQERYTEAEVACRKAIELRPDYPNALYYLGGLLSELERNSEADEVFRLYKQAIHKEIYARIRSQGDLIEQARALRIIGSSRVGHSHLPGEFFVLSKLMIEQLSRVDFEALLTDPNPYARAMGLVCLAQTEKQGAVETIRGYLRGRAGLDVVFYDMIESFSEGQFARSLLRDANFLGHGDKRMPLLLNEELIMTDLEALATDACDSFRYNSALVVTKTIQSGKLNLDVGEVDRHRNRIEPYLFIKGVGRLFFIGVGEFLNPPPFPLHNRVLEFLIECLGSETLDIESRFAAASALTRYTEDAAYDAIETAKGFLDSTSFGPLTSSFLSTIEERREFEKSMGIWRTTTTWKGVEQIIDTVIEALSFSHPFVLPDLLKKAGSAIFRDEDVKRKREQSLICLVNGFSEFCQIWNTYSDSGYLLDQLISRLLGFYLGEEKDDLVSTLERLDEIMDTVYG